MPKRGKCPFCRRLFIPDLRVKERQKTCGRRECRSKQKRQLNARWRSQNPDYFRNLYPQQKEVYGTRAEYKKQYRRQNPEYVRRNAVFVKKCRDKHRKPRSGSVSYISSDLRITL